MGHARDQSGLCERADQAIEEVSRMRKIGFGFNAVPRASEKEIIRIFRSGRYSPNKTLQTFENRLKALHSAKHAIFVNSGTDALRLGLLALKEKLGLKDGDLVAVPSLTFVATVNVILQANLKPFFVDVGMRSYTMNPDNLAWRMQTGNKYPKVLMPVHLFGRRCDQEIYNIARTYGMAVLEDSCETILNPIKGDISCHSTYMAHHLTTGVGGFALTNDDGLSEIMRSLANHGRDPYYLPGHRTPPISEELLRKRFQFPRVGYSCRGTEFEAALGLSQLPHLPEIIKKRQKIVIELRKRLSFDDIQVPDYESDHTWMMFPLVIKETSNLKKYELCLHLERDGIETRDMMPITNQPCFRGLVNENEFTVAKAINERGFYIPCHQGLTLNDIRRIQRSFENFLTKA